MHKSLVICLLWLSTLTHALTTETFKENTDLQMSLSNSNYNRLTVRNDKIIAAHFPEGRMAVRNEEDGSLYVMLASNEPFTLFLTTENGHHFSTTVTGIEELGQTVEFVPQTNVVISQALSRPLAKEAAQPANAIVSNLMNQMISQQKPMGFDESHHFGRVIRLKNNLKLTPKTTFKGLGLEGEVMALYNGGKLPIDVLESWFVDKNVKAVSLSKTTILPKETVMLYRVSELNHG